MGEPRNPRQVIVQALALGALPGLVALAGCGAGGLDDDSARVCITPSTEASSGPTGQANAFLPDPIVQALNPNLSPSSSLLNSLASRVSLERLGGHGVLEGAYVDVRSNLVCDEGFGAFSENNSFLYSHGEPAFQEAMSYYFGDSYRARLDEAGYLLPKEPVRIIAHCMKTDNAFFERSRDSAGRTLGRVCLGDSAKTPGASYADDATVVLHELQHATTVDTYSPIKSMNRFWYDEAGALNEGLSDFMALAFLEPFVLAQGQGASGIDPRVFSRWALGTFLGAYNGTRGAHRCPVYDSDYPRCANFRSDPSGFSADNNTLSYVYPDGVGWPYARNYPGPGYLPSTFTRYGGQEEIHNAAEIVTGTLWDVYDAIKRNHGGDSKEAFRIASRLFMETLAHMPQPTPPLSLSPVTFRGFGSGIVATAAVPEMNISAADRDAIAQALTERGFIGEANKVPAGWAAVGPGRSGTPGVKVQDNPIRLRDWLSAMGSQPGAITHSGGGNGRLGAGELAALWFDVRNQSPVTAGGVQVTVTCNDPDVTILNGGFNIGAVSATQAQIQYGKINGTAIVAALSSTNPTYHVPTGNHYFLTNPRFDASWTTAIFVKIKPTAASGKTVTFRLDLAPSNGAAATVDFPVTLN